MAAGKRKRSKTSEAPESDPAFVSSYEKLGEIFGLHCKSFPRIIRAHPSDTPRPQANGRHSVAAWKQFFETHPEIKRTLGGAGPELIELQLESLRQKNRALIFDNDVADGKYTRNEPITAAIAQLGGDIRNLLRQKLENEYPAKVTKLAIPDARAYGRNLVDQILGKLAQFADEWTI